MFSKLKVALVLVIIGGLSGIIIFEVNELTWERIEANIEEQEKAYYRDIFDLDDDFKMYLDITELDGELDEEILIYEADEDGLRLNDVIYGIAYKDETKNNYGDIILIVGIDLDGKIAKVVIGSNNNTPTFVNKIKSDYLDGFTGQYISAYGVDTFTGASYTYGSVTNAIKLASVHYLDSRGAELLIEQEKNSYKDIFGLDDEFNVYLEITELGGTIAEEIVVYEADGFGEKIDGVIYGTAYKTITNNNYGDITIVTGIDLDGKIAKVVITNSDNVTTFINWIENNHLNAFVGQDISDYSIDSFTGATHTYESVTEAIRVASDYYFESRGDE